MLKGKLKIPDKARKVFPDRLGSLLKGIDGKDEEEKFSGSRPGLEAEFEFGEELEPIVHGIGYGSDNDNKNGDLKLEDDLEVKGRVRSEKETIVVSAKQVIELDEKRSDLEYELSQKEINLEKLQRIAMTGIPDGGSLRPTTWKLLLDYLPASRDLWDKVLAENRLKYAKLKVELLKSPSQSSNAQGRDSGGPTNDDDAGPLRRLDVSNEDHPLSLGEASVWHKFFEHTEIADQIDRDLQRTHPDINFFSGESSLSKKNMDAMRNILLLFAKLNPTTSYVQGMNEVLAPIYYVFSTDTDEQNVAHVEADSFACFVRLLSDSVDHFCQQLDNNISVGIHSALSKLMEILKSNDEQLWRHLEFISKVNPQFYAFRWITLLLTQEFDFRTVIRIWDSLLSNASGVQDMLLRICCAMLLCMKSRLLSGDFAQNLHLLQHYPEINIEHLLQVARDINPDTSTFRVSP